MQRAIFLIILLPLLMTSTTSCREDCEPKSTICRESPPTDEACLAAFNRWFYSPDKNKCEQIGYSGCSSKGFATKEECEECKCK